MKAPSISPHLKVPPYFIPLFSAIALVLVLLVFYERAVVPFMKRITSHPTGISNLQKIGVGHLLSMLVMLILALVKGKRIRVASNHGLLDRTGATIPLSVRCSWPHYGVLAVAEVFWVAGKQRVFYDQMPKGLRSLGATIYLSSIGIGSLISSGIIAIVQAISSSYHEKWLVDNINRAHLDSFYWVLTVICGFGFCGFVWVASKFVYEEVERSDEDEGKEKELRDL